MDDNRLPRQAVHCDISGTKRNPGTPLKNWSIQQDLKSIGMTWEVAQQLAVNRDGWRRRVAQCVLTRDELRTKVRPVNDAIDQPVTPVLMLKADILNLT